MSGAHLRVERRGARRRLAAVVLGTLLLGSLVGGGVTLAVMEADDEDVVDTAGDPDSDATARAVPDPGPVTLAFVGDVYAEPPLADRLAQDPGAFVGPFAEVLGSADLAIANVEAAMTDTGAPLDKEFVFRAPPAILAALGAGGIDVAVNANDHALDHGPDGLAGTLAARDGAEDVAVIGIGADEAQAYAPHVVDVGGQRIAVLAASQVIDPERIEDQTATPERGGIASAKRVDALTDAVAAVRDDADTVVVYLHWGVEGEGCPNVSQQELADALVEAGADVIVGSHAHWVQGSGMKGSAFVSYGLGNFLFGAVDEPTAETGVLLVEVDGRDVAGFEWRPGRIADAVAQPLAGDEADAAVAAWDQKRTCTDLTAGAPAG